MGASPRAADVTQGVSGMVRFKEAAANPHTPRPLLEDESMTDTKERRYGQWAGNPMGNAESPDHCIKEVWPNDRYRMIPYQCCRKRGHGPDGLYCKQHAKKLEG